MKDEPHVSPNRHPPPHWQCAFEDRGIRCENAGGISMSTQGGGPWYCREHIDVVRYSSRDRLQRTNPAGAEQVRESIARIRETFANARDPRDIAASLIAAQHEADEERAAIQSEGDAPQ